MKKNTLKITLIALVAAVCAPMFLTSCSKDVNTRSATFTITNDMWRQGADKNYYCDFPWNAIDDAALSVGNISAYYYLRADDGVDYQQPLPYVYYPDAPFADDSNFFGGNWVAQSINIRYDVSPGRITFMICDLGYYPSDITSFSTMRFRAVVTYPVEY